MKISTLSNGHLTGNSLPKDLSKKLLRLMKKVKKKLSRLNMVSVFTDFQLWNLLKMMKVKRNLLLLMESKNSLGHQAKTLLFILHSQKITKSQESDLLKFLQEEQLLRPFQIRKNSNFSSTHKETIWLSWMSIFKRKQLNTVLSSSIPKNHHSLTNKFWSTEKF